MNKYIFSEIYIGLSESFQHTITENDMELFELISGDYNPMHLDEAFAQKRGYTGRIVYGMLVSSFYSTLVGMYLPGENCLLNACNISYKKPVYVGDELTVIGTVIDKREGTRRIKISAEIHNQDNIVVNTAEIMVSFTYEK